MSNRLDTLVARNLGGSSSLQARTPSLFEPASLQSGPALSRPMQTAPDDWPADLPQDLPEEQHSSQSVPPHSQVARAVEPLDSGREHLNPFTAPRQDRPASLHDQQSGLDPSARRPLQPTTVRSSAPLLPGNTHSELVSGTEKPSPAPIAITDRVTEDPPEKSARRSMPEDREYGGMPVVGKVMHAIMMRERDDYKLSLTHLSASSHGGDERKALRLNEPRAIHFPLSQAPDPEPSIQVTIGRIEIRAEREPSFQKKPERPSPVMGLDEYLRQKNTRVRS